jgi:hypothetical protein
MTTQQITAEENGGTVPVACTLTSADLAAQRDRWEQLAARAMTEGAETAHGLRIFFRSEPGAAEELRALVAVENECCPWADWTVETNNGQIVLNVRSTRQGVATLHAMFRASRGVARTNAAAATRTGDDRVVQWIAGGDSPAKTTVAELVEAVGYAAIDLADIDSCGVMEAPRRPDAVYGEEYRKADADAVVAAVRAGRPIPPPPVY